MSVATPVQVNTFAGGLNLRDQPAVVSAGDAIDLLNVTFTELGAVAQRPGFAKFTAAEGTNRFDSLTAFYKSDGTKQLIAGSGTRLEALSSSGSVVSSATGLSGGPYGFVRFGQPNTEVLYAGNGTDTLRKWTGSAWSTPTATVDTVAGRAMPKARYLAVQTPDNRLVATGFATTTGGPNGATSSPSHVYFSDVGNAESWTSTNFVQLRPGDGESITAVVAWQGRILVFKETALFEFYGNSTDTSGNPVFNYRPIEIGVGVDSPRAITVGRDGIYFMCRKGVYRYRGGSSVELLSDMVAPIFYGQASDFFQSDVLNHAAITACNMAYHDERLYLGYPSGSSTTVDRTLVYDTTHRWWTLYDLPAAAMASFRAGDQADLFFAYSGNGTNNATKDVGRFGATYTSDAGTAIQSRWRSGFPDFGVPYVKTQKFLKLWGDGALRVSVSTDFGYATHSEDLSFTEGVDTWGGGSGTDTWGGGSGTDTWGPNSAIRANTFFRAHRGHVFSVEFTNTVLDQGWSVYRMVFHWKGIGAAQNTNTYTS